jgi:hypothetical protein
MAKRSPKEVRVLSLRAFELIDSGLSPLQVANQLQVSPRTIRRWLSSRADGDAIPEDLDEENDFVSTEIHQSTIPEFGMKGRDIDDLIPLSLNVLRKILEDPEARPADQLRCVAIVGDWGGLAGGLSGSLRRVHELGFEVVDPNLPIEAEGHRSQGLTEEGANLIRAKLLGIED